MADGLCRIHGTVLNGFGNFVFCNECDAENEQQDKYEEDKDSSEEQLHLDDEKDFVEVNFSSIRGGYTIDSDDYGWIVRDKQAPCQQKGKLSLLCNEDLYMVQPHYYSILGAIYRIKLSDVVLLHRQPNNVHSILYSTVVDAEQLLYFNDRVLIGGVDHGPIP